MATDKKPPIADWLNTGIYGVFAFLLIFGFNKLDKALADISQLKSENDLMEYKIELHILQIKDLNDRLHELESY